MTDPDPFWPHVQKTANHWDYISFHDKNDYGIVSVNSVRWHAHRYSWFLAYGPIPEGMKVLHRCDRPRCVNPAHLFLGSNADNCRDKVEKGRQAKGSQNGNSKLIESDATEIKRLLAIPGASQSAIARQFNVSKTLITHIKKGRSWTHVA